MPADPSTDPPPDDAKDPTPPLPYRNYADDRPERRTSIYAFIAGVIPGVLITVASGCFNFQLHFSGQPSRNHLAVPTFGSIAVVTAVLGMMVLRGRPRRFMLGGFLLGVAVTCIIEGICFFGG